MSKPEVPRLKPTENKRLKIRLNKTTGSNEAFLLDISHDTLNAIKITDSKKECKFKKIISEATH